MRELKLTKDANNLFYFLLKHPNKWHSYDAYDPRTKKAVAQLLKAYPSNFEVSTRTNQMKLYLSEWEKKNAWEFAERQIRKNPLKNYLGMSRKISRRKAKLILHHGKVKGYRLTPKQMRFFGARASGYAYKNPKAERLSFLQRLSSDPFYSNLMKRAAARLLRDLKKGSFNKRYWLRTLEAVVERVAREHKIKLSRIDKLKLALKIAKQIWDKYVRRP